MYSSIYILFVRSICIPTACIPTESVHPVSVQSIDLFKTDISTVYIYVYTDGIYTDGISAPSECSVYTCIPPREMQINGVVVDRCGTEKTGTKYAKAIEVRTGVQGVAANEMTTYRGIYENTTKTHS